MASSLLFYGFDMPKGPRNEKRPADVIGAAVMVARIATGEVEDPKVEKNPNAVALGKLVEASKPKPGRVVEEEWPEQPP